jgi:pimeloyl-ACP methyl ester carboxylesterase
MPMIDADGCLPYPSMDATTSRAPNANMTIPDAAHIPNVEQPAAAIELWSAF